VEDKDVDLPASGSKVLKSIVIRKKRDCSVATDISASTDAVFYCFRVTFVGSIKF